MPLDNAREPAPWVVVTGLDGAGKTNLATRLAAVTDAHFFRLPFHAFVCPLLERSGGGTPFGDVHTDRLIFAADARLTNGLIREWRRSYRYIVSQRGWMDNFVFGAVQGVAYSETDALLRTAELERASAIVHLVVDPDVAFARIRDDPGRDKYETPEFLRAQHQETIRFHASVQNRHPTLAPFDGIPNLLIDTTAQSTEQVYATAFGFLRNRKLL